MACTRLWVGPNPRASQGVRAIDMRPSTRTKMQSPIQWSELDQGGGNASIQSGSGHPGTRRVTHDSAVTRECTTTFWWVDDQGRIRDLTTSNTVAVAWTADTN